MDQDDTTIRETAARIARLLVARKETVAVSERISDQPLECLPLRIGKALAAAHLMPLKKRS